MICKKLSEAMGGSIKCESEVGQGSRFIVDIVNEATSPTASMYNDSFDEAIPNEKPLFESISGKIRDPHKKSSKSSTPLKPRILPPLEGPTIDQPRVMVVDDEILCGKVTKAMIESYHITVTLVCHPIQFTRLPLEKKPSKY